jgi:hypothetical protein
MFLRHCRIESLKKQTGYKSKDKPRLKVRRIISFPFQARGFGVERGAKNEHSQSYASDEQRSSVAKD